MNTIIRTSVFDSWLKRLKDPRGKARVIERIRSAERNHFGDCSAVGEGVFEMRVHVGPGYRVYFTRRDHTVYVLLCGGRKRRQQQDIQKARTIARLLKEE
jgi:putative addiction module killer protein